MMISLIFKMFLSINFFAKILVLLITFNVIKLAKKEDMSFILRIFTILMSFVISTGIFYVINNPLLLLIAIIVIAIL